MPVVSVVMPVYNTQKYLEEALDSILAQSFDDFELIAVDDGSTDGSTAILDRYSQKDSRMHVLHQDNSGISAARNNGMRHARGNYIAVMDSDDICLPDRLSRQVALMEKHPEVGLCGTRCSFFGSDGEYAGVVPPVDPDCVKSLLLLVPTLSNTSVMMRRDLMISNNLFYDESLVAAEDYDMSRRFSQYCKITNLPDILMRIRVHNTSTTQQIKDQNDRCLSAVHKRVLSELGIQASKEELEMHLSVSTGTYCMARSREYIACVENWFCKLTQANAITHVYEPSALAKVLFERWSLACLLSREPVWWKIARVRKSKIYMGYGTFLRYCLSLGAKRTFRILKRHATGRLKKRWS
ncbi:glycosyltransferase family 2 protein [bacterium]|nr:glycosyltransferase family 2 protein [bacterium]